MIALSITKAEYVSFSKTAKEVAYLRSLMHEIGMEKYGEIILSVDNLGVLYIAWSCLSCSDEAYMSNSILFARESHLANWSCGMYSRHMTDILIKTLPRLAREMSERTRIADYKFQGFERALDHLKWSFSSRCYCDNRDLDYRFLPIIEMLAMLYGDFLLRSTTTI